MRVKHSVESLFTHIFPSAMDTVLTESLLHNEQSNSSVASCSSDAETASGILTEEMILKEKEEEAKMMQDEAKYLKEKVVKEDKEECFKKLLELMNLSNAYTTYLVEKMRLQEEENRKRDEKLKNKLLERMATSPLAANRGKRKRNSPNENEGRNKRSRMSPKTTGPRRALQADNNSNLPPATSPEVKEESPTSVNSTQQLSEEEEVRLNQPALLTGGVLRKYQLEGVEWMKLLYENGVNGILADEMGLGKTVQCIGLIAHLMANNVPGPYLIVGPLSTLPNWKIEFNKFAPEIPVQVYHGTPDERDRIRRRVFTKVAMRDKKVYPVMLTSYQIVLSDARFLRQHKWHYIVIDEGHRIKNFQCRLVRELKSLHSANRLLMTGTPLQNNLTELWSLLNFLLPEIFTDLGVFEKWFDISEMTKKEGDKEIIRQEQEKKILSSMHQILTPFLLRRTKADVELNLPPKKEILVFAPLSARQSQLYKNSLDRCLTSIAPKEVQVELNAKGRPVRKSTAVHKNFFELSDMVELTDVDVVKEEREKKQVKVVKDLHSNHSINNIMMQLRKVCNHPYLVEQPVSPSGHYIYHPDIVSLSGKLSLLDSLLPPLKKRGHKVLLFSQMVKMLDILEEYCMMKKFAYCRLDGSMKLEDRQEMIEDFNTNPSTFIFLVSTRAGGLGINLTAADTAIIYDSDWNPQADLQAQDRCHRLGQNRPVVVYRLVTANTVDQAIVERATAKRKLEKMIMKKGRFLGKSEKFSTLSAEELLSILESKDHVEMRSTEQQYKLTPKQLDILMDRSNMESSDGEEDGIFKVVATERSNTLDV